MLSRNPRNLVTKDDCNRQHAKIDLALFGVDGRGGMVKDVQDIKTFMLEQGERNKDEKKEVVLKRETSTRWKLAAISALFSVIGIILGYALNKL